MCEALRCSSDLPDSLVWRLPVCLHETDECSLKRPGVRVLSHPGDARVVQGHHHLTDDIGLKLQRGRVADSHR
jgi:hypothetical protein